MTEADIGLIGLAVMGQNLALNMNDHGFKVSVHNRTASKTADFLQGPASSTNISGFDSLEAFVSSLETPRKIIMMIRAGKPVDDLIASLLPLLDKGDIIIDGGNSLFTDSNRRYQELSGEGYYFIGTGISGGEEGARYGPSIMPGGDIAAWPAVKEILQAISAKVDGEPCCQWVGPAGAGHYVKMTHNGIEYGDMQLICEAYSLLKDGLGLDNEDLYKVFAEWNRGELDSYLIEITRDIFSVTDPKTGRSMVDVILDKAGQKGTGKLTSQLALDLGVPTTLITEAVFARTLSALKENRVRASRVLTGPRNAIAEFRASATKDDFINQVRRALFASKVCSYAQGFFQLQAAAAEYGWDLNYGEIAMLWRGGCIIRAAFLEDIKSAYDREPELENLLLDQYFMESVVANQKAWRQVVCTATQLGIPIPAMSAALNYYDFYRSERLPHNLLQAQRDYFGAHTYERVDEEGSFHTEWMKLKR